MHSPTRAVGAATVTVLTTGLLYADLQDWLRVPAEQWEDEHHALFAQPVVVPAQSLLVQAAGLTALVDACDGAMIVGSPFEPPGYRPPSAMETQLAALGISCAEIDVVAITHPHGDHISGLATGEAGARVPAFPRARHLLQRADWELLAADLADERSLEAQTLGVVARAGLLDVVDGPVDCGHGVSLVPAPGETPGHQLARVASEGQVCYALGDLYHHAVEVARPGWRVHWAEREATARSRAALVAAAVGERALLVAAHIPGFGRLALTADGATWAPA